MDFQNSQNISSPLLLRVGKAGYEPLLNRLASSGRVRCHYYSTGSKLPLLLFKAGFRKCFVNNQLNETEKSDIC